MIYTLYWLASSAADEAANRGGGDYATAYREYYRRHPDRGYGPMFRRWGASHEEIPYGSFGNGSAMRVSPVGWAFHTLEEVLDEARKSAEVTHNHPEGIKGAQAVAAAVFMARTGSGKAEIRDYIGATFGYRLNHSLERIREDYPPDITCPGSVPQSITAFLVSESVEDTIRNAVSLGGDSDTVACIAGGIAEAFYGGVPEDIRERVFGYLDDQLSDVIEAFNERFRKEGGQTMTNAIRLIAPYWYQGTWVFDNPAVDLAERVEPGT